MAQVPEPAPWVASGDETDRVSGPPAFLRSGIVDVGVPDGRWGDSRGQVEVAVSALPLELVVSVIHSDLTLRLKTARRAA